MLFRKLKELFVYHKVRKGRNQLAMLAWYLADSNGLSLDKNLLLRYALVHDFVEVYAGDTPVYSKNQQDHDTKKRTRRIFTSSHRKRIPRV
jgi:5'-deoxynucleotidase YfbR-like HD superfamily hydrolase